MDYECGTCGARTVRVFADHQIGGFAVECGNGHRVVPVPGSEFVLGSRLTPVEETSTADWCGVCRHALSVHAATGCTAGGCLCGLRARLVEDSRETTSDHRVMVRPPWIDPSTGGPA